MNINIHSIDDRLIFLIAAWLHLFNVIFVVLGGLSNIQLQLLVLLSVPMFFILALRGVRSVAFKKILPPMMGLIILVCCFGVVIEAEVSILIRVINFLYLNCFVYLFLASIKGGMNRLLYFYSLLGLPVLLLLIAQVIGVEFRSDLSVQPNYIGMIVISIAMSSLVVKVLAQRILFLVISFLILLLISSRAAIILLLIIILLDAFWLRKYGYLKLKSTSSRLLLICIYSAASFSVLGGFFIEALMLDDEYRGVGTGLSGRVFRWEAAFDGWLENPVIGVGFGESSSYLGFTADNAYLTILLELGIVGLVLYILINSFALSSSFRSGKKLNTIFIALYLIYGIFEKRYFGIGNSFSILYLFVLFSSFQVTVMNGSIKRVKVKI